MAQERLSLRKTREILRLKEEAGLSNRVIARACKISNSTVGEYLCVVPEQQGYTGHCRKGLAKTSYSKGCFQFLFKKIER
jgi:hypothetical protein